MLTARECGLMRCHECGKLIQAIEHTKEKQLCPRCNHPVHMRIPKSLQKTWALLISSIFFYIPANLLPIMTVKKLGVGEPHTILSGIVELIHSGLYPIAALVFIASILVPLFKIIGMILLLLSIHYRWEMKKRERVVMFHLIHFIGRWSMLDIFMIALLTALVSLGKMAEIEAGAGCTSFAIVVILTMLAAKSFDTRLIWDNISKTNT